MIIGKRLKELRKENQLTQEDVANVLGVSKSTICCYEKGHRKFSQENLMDLVMLYNVSADYLLGLDHRFVVLENGEEEVKVFSKEEALFVEEIKKDKVLYALLFENPKRGVKRVKDKFR